METQVALPRRYHEACEPAFLPGSHHVDAAGPGILKVRITRTDKKKKKNSSHLSCYFRCVEKASVQKVLQKGTKSKTPFTRSKARQECIQQE